MFLITLLEALLVSDIFSCTFIYFKPSHVKKFCIEMIGSPQHPLHLTDCITTSPTSKNLLEEEQEIAVYEIQVTSTT